jgi:TetR/AcrR family transcriptional regulator
MIAPLRTVEISAFCVFRLANRHTFGTLFDHDLTDPNLRDRYRTMLGDLIVDYLCAGGG